MGAYQFPTTRPIPPKWMNLLSTIQFNYLTLFKTVFSRSSDFIHVFSIDINSQTNFMLYVISSSFVS